MKTAWKRQRESSLTQIFAALQRATSREEDCRKLERAMEGIRAGFDLQEAFVGRSSVTGEELRRLVFRRIVAALQSCTQLEQLGRVVGPQSDDFEAMAAAFPSQMRVCPSDCWWASPGGLPPEEPPDVRLPPPQQRSPTLRVDGLYDLHCRSCRKHDRLDGDWRDEGAHWQCRIHQLLFDLDGVRFPFEPTLRPDPTAPHIVEQIIERDPVIAAQLESIVDTSLDNGTLVYARPGEVRVVVPTAAAISYPWKLSMEEERVAGDLVQSPDPRNMLPLAAAKAAAIITAQVAATHGLRGATARGSLERVIREQCCGPPKIRMISCHNEGLNNFTIATPMSFSGPEELHGRVPSINTGTRMTYIMNDNKDGFKAIRVAASEQRYLGLHHPTRRGVIMKSPTLDYGQQNAPFFFAAFTSILNHGIRYWLGADGWSIFYLDDNGVLCRLDRASELLRELDALAQRCGYAYSLSKRQMADLVKCLGRQLDVNSSVIAILPLKLYRCLVLLEVVVGLIDYAIANPGTEADLVGPHWLEKLAGTIQWLAECTYSGRLHTAPFWYAAGEAARLPAFHLSRCSGLKAACRWWLDLAASGRLRGHRSIALAELPDLRLALDPSQRPLPTAHSRQALALQMTTTSLRLQRPGATARCLSIASRVMRERLPGGVVANRAVYGQWSPAQQRWSSTARELFVPDIMLSLHTTLLKRAFVVPVLDNAGAALALNHGKAGTPTERSLLASIFARVDEMGGVCGVVEFTEGHGRC